MLRIFFYLLDAHHNDTQVLSIQKKEKKERAEGKGVVRLSYVIGTSYLLAYLLLFLP